MGKDRRKDAQGDRYKPPANGHRDYPDVHDPRVEVVEGRELRKIDMLEGRPEIRDQRNLDMQGDDAHVERRGSGRHHRDRSVKEQRRSPSKERDAHRYKDIENVDFKDTQIPRHRILIDHASDTPTASEDSREMDRFNEGKNKQHLDPSSAASRSSRNNRKKLESMLRNDSLSSDPSDCVRPPPPKPHRHKRGKKQRHNSISSSDDDVRSTPECSSCEEQEIESESVSEKGKSVNIRNFLFIHVKTFSDIQ